MRKKYKMKNEKNNEIKNKNLSLSLKLPIRAVPIEIGLYTISPYRLDVCELKG